MFTRGPLLGLRFIIFAVISIFFMILDHHHRYLGSLKLWLNKGVAPLQYTAAWPNRLVETIAQNAVSYNHLKHENKRLLKENFLIKIQLQKVLSLEQENAQLRSLSKASFKNHAHKILVAETLAVDADFFSHEILIDKGSKQGVYTGQAVLDENGIMGQVINTTPQSSRVLLISDSRSAIPVQNYRTGMRGLLVGNGSQHHLLLRNIPITADVQIGDILMSSGLDGRYPPGIPVGIVYTVQHKSQEQFAVILVEPKALINKNRLVVLIWPNITQGSQNETP